MGAPLWTETHAPGLDDLSQPGVRDHLRRVTDEPMNLAVQSPPDVGKTATVHTLARETRANPENDLIKLNVADFFNRTKKQIRADPRFERFLDSRSRMTKRGVISRVLGESAGYALMSGEYKTITFDSTGSIREDFQRALRRMMGQHHRTT